MKILQAVSKEGFIVSASVKSFNACCVLFMNSIRKRAYSTLRSSFFGYLLQISREEKKSRLIDGPNVIFKENLNKSHVNGAKSLASAHNSVHFH